MSTESLHTQHTVRLLLIDDDRADYVIARDLLEDVTHAAYDITWVSGLEDARIAFKKGTYDAVLLDFMLGSHTGVDVLRALDAQHCDTPIIMLTALDDRAVDEAALEAGAEEFLTKDTLNASMLDRTIRHAIEKHRLRNQIVRSRDDVRTILDELRIGTAITRGDGERVGFASESFLRFVGTSRDDVIGARWIDVLPVTETERGEIARLLEVPARERSKLPLLFKTRGGRRYWLELEIIDDPVDVKRKIFVLYDVVGSAWLAEALGWAGRVSRHSG